MAYRHRSKRVATLIQYPVITACYQCGTKEDNNSFCRNCGQTLCERCDRFHLECTSTPKQNAIYITQWKNSNNGEAFCAKHGKRLSFYCRTCFVLFCQICLHETHRDHDFLDADEYANELQNKATAEESKKIEESKNNLRHIEEKKREYFGACQNCRASVMSAARALHAEIDRIKVELLSTVDRFKSKGLSVYDEAKYKEKSTMEELQRSRGPTRWSRHRRKRDDIYLMKMISDDHVKKEVELNLDDAYSYGMFDDFTEEGPNAKPYNPSHPTIEHRRQEICKTEVSKLFGTIHYRDAEMSMTSLAESLPDESTESLREQLLSFTLGRNFPFDK